MIDLTSSLPSEFIIGGSAYRIKTDFKTWLEVGEIMRYEYSLVDLLFLFEHEHPTFETQEETTDFAEAVKEFYLNENVTPRQSDEEREHTRPLYDYFLDGEYIYASFMQAYGIDLIDNNMHYHKFKALMGSLPQDTKIVQIMGHRAYEPGDHKKKPEQVAMELKSIWELPESAADKEDFLAQINDMFYNA